MSEACALVKIPAGKLYVTPLYVQVVGHPGTAGLRRVLVTGSLPHKLPELAPSVMCLMVHAPYLVIGDHSFVYPRSGGPMTEPGRALRACEGSRRAGTFRADSLDVGACMRTGWKAGLVRLSPTEGGFACEFEPTQAG